MGSTQHSVSPADVSMLAEDVVGRVWQRLAGYDAEHLTRQELEQFARSHITLVSAAVSERRPLTDRELELAAELGSIRALQGVPLDSVLMSFAVAERLFIDIVLARDAPWPQLRDQAHLIGELFAELQEVARTAYRAAQREITVHFDRLENDLVAELSLGDEAHPADVAMRARAIDADPESPYVAVAATIPEPVTPQPDRGRRHLLASLTRHASGRILSGSKAGATLLLVPTADGRAPVLEGLAQVLDVSSLLRDHVVSVGEEAATLAAVGRSARQALAAGRVATALGRIGRVTAYEEVLVEALLLADPEAAQRLIDGHLGGLSAMPYLIDTLAAWLEADCSSSEASRRLHVHPNTVSYRLNRIRELTGRSLQSTGDVVELHLALRARQLVSTRPR